MVEERPMYQMGRYNGKTIEPVKQSHFDKIELDKGDMVVVFNAQEFKEWHDEILESLKRIIDCSKVLKQYKYHLEPKNE